MFLIGVVIGVILGVPLGMFIFSLMLCAKRSQIEFAQSRSDIETTLMS